MPGLASTTASTTPRRPGGAGRLLSFAGQLRLRVLPWHRTRVAQAELAAMDDRMLADIGVPRSALARSLCAGQG